MISNKLFGLDDFLRAYPGMTTAPCNNGLVKLQGGLRLNAKAENGEEVEDTYFLKILVPFNFPDGIPQVWETGGRIPREPDFHVYGDGCLCLGSCLRLIGILHYFPCLLDFANKCIVPYLYATTLILKYGKRYIFGELEHGYKGLEDDYCELLKLKNKKQLLPALEALRLKKRIANKQKCPCECKMRLGKCKYHLILNKHRKITHRNRFEMIIKELREQNSIKSQPLFNN